jgi:hypothetical protein
LKVVSGETSGAGNEGNPASLSQALRAAFHASLIQGAASKTFSLGLFAAGDRG